MISDTLYEAREEIEKYMNDETYKETYEEHFLEIKEVLHRMQMLQLKLEGKK